MSHQNAIGDANIVEEFETNQSWTWVARLTGLLVFATAVYKYCRTVLYPCITPTELENAMKCLQTVYSKCVGLRATVSLPDDICMLMAPEWSKTEDEYLDVNIVASKILEKHHHIGSVWWKYVGINPGLMPEIARWYDRSEELKRKILQLHERDRQSRFEAERYRRQAIRQPPVPYTSPAYENPYRSIMDGSQTNSFTTEVLNLRGRRSSATSGARSRRIYPNGGVDSHIE
ncbi:hypothetical protein PM082_015207 [Marasmius tenuissimus]|nr:hypothetical protein PM082_015207 [Marasmius tenuissimus]